jgi:hypothetical protein
MGKDAGRTKVAVAIAALGAVLLIASGPGQATAGGHRHRYLPVHCNSDFFEVTLQTGSQLAAQYNAMGFDIGSPQDVTEGGANTNGHSIDGWGTTEACRYAGTRHHKGGASTGVREGKGELDDILSDGEQPFPGETNPAIREYDWTWKELVFHNKKGVLVGTVSGPVTCTKQSYDGYPLSEVRNVREYPC